MNKLAIFLSFFILISISLGQSDTTNKLYQLIDKYNISGLSLTFLLDNQIVYKNGFGYSDIESQKLISSDTQYRIASVAKTITVTGLMKLFDIGLFNLDDDISIYLGYIVRNPNFPELPITIKQIMSHTSSIVCNQDNYNSFLFDSLNSIDLPAIKDILFQGGKYYNSSATFLKNEPGTYFSYCNLNFGIIGSLIEIFSGQRFDIYMKKNILDPLGMYEASYNVANLKNIDNLAVLYAGNENYEFIPIKDNFQGIQPQQKNLQNYFLGKNGIIYEPYGGLRVSVIELANFQFMLSNQGSLFGKEIISKRSFQHMTTATWIYDGVNGDNLEGKINSYGFGTIITRNIQNQDLIWINKIMIGHAGEAQGLISMNFYDPIIKAGFTFAINGCKNPDGYQQSKTSAYYQVEQDIWEIAFNYLFPPWIIKHSYAYYDPQIMKKLIAQ